MCSIPNSLSLSAFVPLINYCVHLGMWVEPEEANWVPEMASVTHLKKIAPTSLHDCCCKVGVKKGNALQVTSSAVMTFVAVLYVHTGNSRKISSREKTFLIKIEFSSSSVVLFTMRPNQPISPQKAGKGVTMAICLRPPPWRGEKRGRPI